MCAAFEGQAPMLREHSQEASYSGTDEGEGSDDPTAAGLLSASESIGSEAGKELAQASPAASSQTRMPPDALPLERVSR